MTYALPWENLQEIVAALRLHDLRDIAETSHAGALMTG